MSFRYFKHWLRFTSIPSIFILVLIFISHLSTAFAQISPKGGIDWILVVDTSASMRGVGGTKNIFDDRKQRDRTNGY